MYDSVVDKFALNKDLGRTGTGIRADHRTEVGLTRLYPSDAPAVAFFQQLLALD